MSQCIPNRFSAPAVKIAALACALLSSSLAYGDAYNIILKTAAGTPSACAVGGFFFTHTQATPVGNYAPDSISVTLPENCIDSHPPVTLSTAGSPAPAVVVANVETLAVTQPQNNKHGDKAISVVGLKGKIVETSSNNRKYVITFSFTGGSSIDGNTFNFDTARTFELQQFKNNGDAIGTPTTGQYYVINTARSIPEPTTLTLLAGAAFGLWAVRHRRRTRELVPR